MTYVILHTWVRVVPYSFIYDLTSISQGVLRQLLELVGKAGSNRFLGDHAKRLVKAFKLDRATGLSLVDAVALVEDLNEVQVANRIQRDKFEKAQRKALLLPHCARSHMDKRCMADFEADVPAYQCRSCRESCLINRATALGKAEGYDVYVIPGGACAERILKSQKI